MSIFSGKIRCGECGGSFGAKVWHSTDKYRRTIYRCNNKYDGQKCRTPHVMEKEIKEAFVTAFNRLVTEREEIVTNARLVRQTLCAEITDIHRHLGELRNARVFHIESERTPALLRARRSISAATKDW